MTNTDDLRAMIAFADATNRGVVVPEGEYDLDRPLHLPASGRLSTSGPVTFRPAPGVSLGAALLAVNPSQDMPPNLTPGVGLRGNGTGWLNLRDVWQPTGPATSLHFDIAFTLDSLNPDGHTIASASGSFDNVMGDTPLLITVGNTDLYVTVAGTRYHATVAANDPTRVVVSQTATHLCVWIINGAGAALIADVDVPAITWPDWCDLTIGQNPYRWPEGTPNGLGLHPGAVIHAVCVYANAFYNAANPPSGTGVIHQPLGLVIDFTTTIAEGCIVPAFIDLTRPAFLIWRNSTNDLGGYKFDFSGVTIDGMGRVGAGVYVAGAHDWSIDGLSVIGCRYGLLLQSQCYSGRISRPHVSNNVVGLALCNNSGIVLIDSPHLGEGNYYGLVASDSDTLTLNGGWVANNAVVNIVVKGDQCGIVFNGTTGGFEGTQGVHNILLFHCSSAVFLGGAWLALTSPIPVVEMHDCSGGLFLGTRFGVRDDTPGIVRTLGHDANRPVEITEGRRWGTTGQSVPILDPANT